ncbi:DUF624 domain-containing protein [Kallotenue papyrolyticum]|uniref:DUF624 domain-containing protein n=1 Tax=Kallotenue papyrolyticum TaxID=1325125 RepID=UPI000492CD5E|nr:YesL family protein [Kallotenue papyrolyticum]
MTRDQAPFQPSPRRAPSVRVAFQTLWRTLRHAYDNLGTLLIASLLWYLGALLILPIGIVTAALYRVTRPMSEERAASWRSFFDYWRADLRWGTELTAVLIFGFTLLQVNAGFYAAAAWEPLRWLATVSLGLMLVWAGVALYAFPLALRQQQQRLTTTLRNAFVMAMANAPGTLLSLILLGLLVGVLLLLPPLFVFVPGVIALWGQENARLLLVTSGFLPPDEIADRGLLRQEQQAAADDPAARRARRHDPSRRL